MKSNLALLWALLLAAPIHSFADCTSPAKPAGALEYFSAENTYKFCDGANWVAFGNTGTAGACSKEAEMDYNATDKAYRFCDGTNWIKTTLACTIGPGSMSYQNKVVDTTNLDAPIAIKLSPDGSKAYTVGQWTNRVAVWDISNSPAAPTLLGVMNAHANLNDAADLAIYGNYAYVAARGNNNLAVVDISNPAAPAYVTRAQASTTSEMTNIWGVAIADDGQHAYTVSWSSGSTSDKCYFHTIDISTPTSPSVIASLNLTDAGTGWQYCNELSVRGNTAYVVHADGGIATVNITTPSSPAYLDHVYNANAAQSRGHDLSSDGRYLYTVTYQNSKMNVFSVSNINSLSHVTQLTDATSLDSAYGAAAVGNYVFVTANNTNSIAAINVSTPSVPIKVDAISDATNLAGAENLAVHGRYAYVINYSGDSLAVIDLGCDPAGGGTTYGACSKEGAIDYLTGDGVLAWCDGSQWKGLGEPETVASDPDFDNVVLLIQPDESSSTVEDLSPSAHTPNPLNGAALSTAIADPWGGSRKIIALSGDDYVSVPDSADWHMSSGDFTWEAWVYQTTLGSNDWRLYFGQYTDATSGQYVGVGNISGWDVGAVYEHDSTPYLAPNQGGDRLSPTNTWEHWAIVRNGNTFSLYVDGSIVGSATSSGALTDFSAPFVIGGSDAGAGFGVSGYMTGIRVTKGIARYTSAFTPPAEPFPVSSGPDSTPDTVDWSDFNNTSSSQSIPGINQTINLEFSVVYGTGTPVVEFRKNGGAWTTFTPGLAATPTANNNDTFEFQVSGTTGDSATITVTNLSDGNTILDTAVGTVGDVVLAGSVDFNGSDEYMQRTFGTPTTANKWTFSTWFKRAAGGPTYQSIFEGGGTHIQLTTSNGELYIWEDAGAVNEVVQKNAAVTDTTTWHHLVVAADTSQTAPNNIKVYLDGVEITSFDIDNRSNWDGGFNQGINDAVAHRVGSNYLDTEEYTGRLSETHFIDGQMLDHTYFGYDDSGLWSPKTYAGTYGSNGFHLFGPNLALADIGNDESANNNDFTLGNMDSTNYNTDYPPTIPPGGNYFVLTSGTWDGGFGGLGGADAACLSDLQANNWQGKANVTLDSSTVKAWLCDGSSCNSTLASTTYTFARSGSATSGGATFTTDAGGLGPNDSANWSGATYFDGAYSYWSTHFFTSGTAWANSSNTAHCTAWTTNSSGQQGYHGTSNATDYLRWMTMSPGTCDLTRRLVCLVDDAGPPDVTADTVDWVDFNNISSSQAITGINQTINLEFSVAYGTGTPTVEFRKNGGSWTGFTPGLAATPTADNNDTFEFQVSGTDGDSATITVKNTSDSNATLDSVVGTVSAAPNYGFFVLTAGTHDGALGGLSGANSTCLSDLQANDWLGKNEATLDAAHVRAFLCDSSTCNDLLPSTEYRFGVAGNPAAGGLSFTTDASGTGPGDSTNWADANCFGAPVLYAWTGRAAGTPTNWPTTPDGTAHCSNWSSNAAGSRGIYGRSSSTSSGRWAISNPQCNGTYRLICIVDPGGADVTPDAVNWADFNNLSSSQTMTGIDSTISLEFSVVYGTGTPTVEFRKNGGTWTAFTPGLAATPTAVDGDAFEFQVSGTDGDSATITITNLSDGNTVLDTVVGTVASVQVNYTDSGLVTAFSGTHTHSAVGIGTASADRLVIATIGLERQGGSEMTWTLSGVTIGGVAASKAVAASDNWWDVCEIWYANVPSGTTADIVLDSGGNNIDESAIAVYSATGLSSFTPVSSDAENVTTNTGTSTLNVPSGGFSVYVARSQSGDNGENFSWSSAIENIERDASYMTSAHSLKTTASALTSHAETASHAATGTTICGASWGN